MTSERLKILTPSLPRVTDSVSEDHESLRAQVIPIGVRQMLAPEAWAFSSGQGTRLATLSTGIDIEHEDIKPNLDASKSFIGDDDPNDGGERGTFEGGLMVAPDNEIGIIGAAPRAKLYSAKVIKNDDTFSPEDFVRALEWCADSKVDVVHIPFSFREPDSRVEAACKQLSDDGILLVSFLSKYQDVPIYPGAWPCVMSTGPQVFSSSPEHQAELYAWTGSMYSTLPQRYGISGFGWWAAGALIAATACLAKAIRPSLTGDEVRAHLVKTADPVGGNARRVNALNAVKSLK